MDKIFDLIKWIDNPFKLLAVLLVGVVAGLGFIVYQNQDIFLSHVQHNLMLKEKDVLVKESKALLRDTTAKSVVVHEIHVKQNERITHVAIASDGSRNPGLEGYTVSLFNNGSNNRNKATIAMISGEVYCADFKSSSKVGKWMDYHNVKYLCRAPIGPLGQLHGYIAIGFERKPDDLISAKSRALIAAKEMCK